MRLYLKRETGWIGALGTLTLLINDTPLVHLANNESTTLPLKQGTATLQVKGQKKGSIQVSAGDHVTISANPLFTAFYLLALILLISSFLISDKSIKSILSFGFAGIILLTTLVIPHYKLTKSTH